MTTHSLVFIDSRVSDYQTLVAGLPVDTKWVLLDAVRDGVLQMQRATQNYANLHSIQIIAHGRPGEVVLGSIELNQNTVDTHILALNAIGQSLSEAGDVQIYACEVGQGSIGRNFVRVLSEAVGAYVAVASAPVGHADLGGRWMLDVGHATAVQLKMPDWTGLLGLTSTALTLSYPGHSSGEQRNSYSFAALRADGSVVTWRSVDSIGVAASLDGSTIDVTQIFSNKYAFAALRANGSVVTWGDPAYGGTSNGVAAKLDGSVDVMQIFSTGSAFAALRADGSVVTWGDLTYGGDSTGVAAKLDGSVDVTQMFSNEYAFAALRADGSVVTWGYPDWGGNSTGVAALLDGSTIDVAKIFSTQVAFAALRTDGSVVTWGSAVWGGNSTGVAALIDGSTIDVTQIFSNQSAFAALRADGSVVTWGYPGYGGNSTGVAALIDGSTIDVTEIFSTLGGFAALRADGSVVTWGNNYYGGNSTGVAALIDGSSIDVTKIFSTDGAFAALRADGSVVTWGNSDYGGTSTGVAAKLDGSIDVTQIFSNQYAFAALRADGSVVTWGYDGYGGDSTGVAALIDGRVDVTQIFSSEVAFAALRADGSVITWGDGPDSTNVASQLTNVVSMANPYTNDVYTSASVAGPDLNHLDIDLLGNSWSKNGDSFTFAGKIKLGRADGSFRLEVANAHVVVTGGTASISGDYSIIDGTNRIALFAVAQAAPLVIDLDTTRIITDLAPAPSVALAGIHVTEFSNLTIEADGLRIAAVTTDPLATLGVKVPGMISGIGDLTINNMGLDADGFHWKGLTEIEVPFLPKGDIKLFNSITGHSDGLTATYDLLEDSLSLTGGLSVSNLPWLSTDAKLALTLDEPGITYDDGAFAANVKLTATDIALRGGFKLNEANLAFNTTNKAIAADADMIMPFFKKGELGIQAGLSFNWDPFTLDSASLNATLPGLGIAIGTTGAFLTSIGGGVTGWSTNETTFNGDLGLSFVKKIMTLDLHGQYTSGGKIAGSVTGSLIDPSCVTFSGGCDIDLNGSTVKLAGSFDFGDGLIQTAGSLATDFALSNVSISGTSIWGGIEAQSLFQLSNDNIASNDWIKAWVVVDNPLYFADSIFSFGPETIVNGLKYVMDPSLGQLDRISTFGAEGVPQIGSWLATADMDVLVVRAEWATEIADSTLVHTQVVAYEYDANAVNHHGAVKYTYTEDQYAAHAIAIVTGFNSTTSKTIAIGRPEAGLVWDVEITNAISLGLGTVEFSASVPVEGGTLALESVTNQNNLVTIQYDATDANTGAKVYFFADTDATGFDGVFIGDSTDIKQNGQFVWNAQEQAAGTYHLYALLADDEAAPVQLYFDTPVTLTGPSAITVAGMTDNADTLVGSASDDYFKGGLGDDTLEGGAGNDTLMGGFGDDILKGGAGNNLLKGNDGDDTYVISSTTTDLVFEVVNGGIDTIEAGFTYTLVGPSNSVKNAANIENLTLSGTAAINGTGTAEDNILRGNTAANILQGLAGDDTLDGGLGIDKLFGGLGNDTYQVNLTAAGGLQDSITELDKQGTDTLSLQGSTTNLAAVTLTLATTLENLDASSTGSSKLNLTGNTTANTLTGNVAANMLRGLVGNDTLVGGAGNDALDGGVGNDSLIGGVGDDTYLIDNGGDIVTEEADSGMDLAKVGIAAVVTPYSNTYTLTTNVENATLTNTIAYNLTGNTGNNALTGNAAINTLTGDDGDDTLDGLGGADSLVGGNGSDTYVLDNAGDHINETGIGLSDRDRAKANFAIDLTQTKYDGIEDAEVTGTVALSLKGDGGNNLLVGNSAANLLDGGLGADTLRGASGSDTYVIDDAADLIEENGPATDIDLVNVKIETADGNYILGTNLEKATLLSGVAYNLTGNALANTLTGNTLANTLDGGIGKDILIGGLGNDTYVVDNALDVITESLPIGGTDTVHSSINWTLGTNLENLTLTGTANTNGTGTTLTNTLTGNSGNNILNGLLGADTLIGGAGDDTYIVDNVGDVVTENANEGTDLIKVGIASVNGTYTLGANIENGTLINTVAFNLSGNELDNVLIGNAANNTLDGMAGTDILNGGGGNDSYIVDNAGDTILDSAGIDTVQSSVSYTLTSTPTNTLENLMLTGAVIINGTGNALANILTGNDGANVLTGLAGNDTYIIGAGDSIVEEALNGGIDLAQSSASHTLEANVENLTLIGTGDINGTGNTQANILLGNSGNNILDGMAGIDQLIGGDGDDIFIVDNLGDKVSETNALASGGYDEVQSSITYKLGINLENLTLTGNANINATGNTLYNIIKGNSGNNMIDGGAGSDWMIGGQGDDIYIVDTIDHQHNIIDVIDEEYDAGNDTVMVTAKLPKGEGSSYRLRANVENGILTAITHVASLYGNELDNILTGNAAGNVLNGFGGADTMNGGAGNDMYYVDDTGDFIIDSAGIDTVEAFISYTLADKVNLENIILSSSQGQINGTGNALANILDSESDCVSLLVGLGGNDIYIVNTGDSVVEEVNEGIDLVRSQVSFTLGDNVEHLTLTESDEINGTGNALANTITGNSGNNTLDGKAGADILVGGLGNDTYLVNLKQVGTGIAMTVALEDTITETAVLGSGIDTVQLSGTFALSKATTLTLGANLENMDASGAIYTKLNLSGNIAANTLTGNNEANILNGMGGNDQLLGGAGADTLTGGIGNDTLTGGADNDIFRFDSALKANIDTITDFTTGDKIQLENAIFTKLVTLGALSVANFVSGAAVDPNDFILYDSATGNLYYDADASGAGVAVQFATLTGMPTLTVSDFMVA